MQQLQNKDTNEFIDNVILAQELLKDEKILNAIQLLKDHLDEKNIPEKVIEQLSSLRQQADKIIENKEKAVNPERVYMDGGFDMMHSGHYNALRQAKTMADILVVGVNKDEDLLILKGPTVMNVHERTEIMRHCKFVDEIISDTEYTPDLELLQKMNCGYYAHGDDPCYNSDGTDVTLAFKQRGMFKQVKRTEGVSTTDITERLLKLAKNKIMEEQIGMDDFAVKEDKYDDPPQQQFLANTRRIINFANKKVPKASDTVVYVSGSFDLLHHGHLKRLEEAKKLGDFLYIGLWDDEMTRYYKGESYPIVSTQERVLMCLSCKYVDDIVIGAPFILTQDLISSLKIDVVVKMTGTDEDKVLKRYQNVEPLQIARDQGILREITIQDPFYDITTEKLAERVLNNNEAYQQKVDKKKLSQKVYYDSKEQQEYQEELQ